MKKEQTKITDTIMPDEEDLLAGITIGCVIFGFKDETLKILLNKYKIGEKWLLPGGFIFKEEDVNKAACRILKIRTSLENVFLRQFYLFGDRGRTDSQDSLLLLKNFNIEDKEHWFVERSLKLGYYALVKQEEVIINQDAKIEAIKWFDLDDLPPLYADHDEIIDKALSTIRVQLGYIPLGFELLPEKFTMPELRSIYEAIVGKELDRRNFQRKMLSIGLIKRLNEKKKKGAHKSPYLYTFNKERYEEALKSGIQLMAWNMQ